MVGLLLAACRVLACLQDIQTLKQTSNTPQQHTKKDASPEEVPVIDMSAPAADASTEPLLDEGRRVDVTGSECTTMTLPWLRGRGTSSTQLAPTRLPEVWVGRCKG